MSVYYSKTRKRWACDLRLVLPGGVKRRHQTFHTSKAEATRAEREVKALVQELRAREMLGLAVPAAHRAATSAPTFAEYFERWIAGREAAGLRASTILGYRQHGNGRLLPRFGPLPLDEVNVAAIQAAVTAWRADGMGLGGVRAALRTLSACLGRAAREDLIPRNPVPRVALPRRRDDEVEHKALTEDEAARLVAELRPHWAALTRVALGTGLRISELGRLRWADLDLRADPPRLTLNRAKSGRARLVPILPDAVQTLRAWPRSLSGRVFTSLALDETTGNVDSNTRSNFAAALRRAAARAGIAGRVTPHCLRHTWATRLGLAGVPVEALRVWGGWSDLGMVSRYCNADPVEALAAFGVAQSRLGRGRAARRAC